MKIICFMILFVPIMLTPAFAQSPITVDIDTTEFVAGEIVELTGKVDAGLEGRPVGVEIKDTEGNVILIRTVTSDINGEFTLKFKVPSTVNIGEIITNVEQDGQSFSETKSIESIKSNESQFIPEPVSDITCGEGTIEKDGVCVTDTRTISTEENSGCLIATATYGSEMANEVQQLRELRDNQLLNTESGTNFMNYFNNFYYSFSPIIADYERENPIFKEVVKVAITPMISSLSILNYVDMNSEESVLVYGISIILLNIGMYVGVPIVAIIGIKKKF